MGKDIKHALVLETITIWEQLYGSVLSEDEAMDIIKNTSSLFDLLDQWDRDSHIEHETLTTADKSIGGKYAA